MTDYSELIRKARAVPGPTMLTTYPARTTPDPLSNALADALEAQAKEISQYKVDINEALLDCKSLRARIVELEKREKHLEEMFHGWRDEANKASARIAELEAENAVLSARCQALFSLLPDEIRIGDIQKAVAALRGEKG